MQLFFLVLTYICFGAQKNRLIETILLSTHNIIGFGWEKRKTFSVMHSYLGAWSMIREYPNHTLQTNPRYCEEDPQNTNSHKTSGIR